MAPIFVLILVPETCVKARPKNEFQVNVVNGISDNILIRCQSKDNDLGFHTLHVGDDFSWHFQTNLIGGTLFFCHFWWNSKDKSFNVFDETQWEDKCQYHEGSGPFRKCFWLVKPDGFYFSNYNGPFPTGWEKIYGWT
ncbi:hypothetical protein RJ640_020025 [Escallonia rubra]|uniref:S-protein homolog n=1 Tax=Escallonia rubra TaxID=112253 RepID=A0AA88QZG2_9ASTE|nr:hypothetical protein RJ640_020025 [Escallonia rubra]